MAEVFQFTQDLRHLADYDRGEHFARGDVLSLIQKAEQAVQGFDAVKGEFEARFFLMCLLTWGSIERRR